MTTITICGGGNLGHTCIGMFSRQKDISISLLTSHPERWHHEIDVFLPDGKRITGRIDRISSRAEEVIPESDIVLLCVPAFLVETTLRNIRPHLHKETVVGSVVANTGFFLFCHDLLPRDTRLFGLQRVPYVSRTIEYGRSANLLGTRPELTMAVENVAEKEAFRLFCERIFAESVSYADSFYEVTLSNSNPILHTGRLFTLWHDWNGEPLDRCPLFYAEWTDEASELEIRMDKEFFAVLRALDVNTGRIDTLLAHYEATDAQGMTRKIRSIAPFAHILSPMTQTADGWLPDFKSRYFTEDFPFGLRFIRDLAHKHHVPVPYIDKVYEWGSRMIAERG